MNKPKTLDNRATQAFVSDYLSATELCEAHPRADDIFSGVLSARTEGDTATRALSRKTLFHIVVQCPDITVDAVNVATHRRYAGSTLQAYAARARVLSKALEALAGGAGVHHTAQSASRPLTIKQERERIDAPYEAQLQERLARPTPATTCVPEGATCRHDPIDLGTVARLCSLADLAAV